MSSYNDIKNHIQGVSTTKKITNAMYLLSTSRQKKSLMLVPYLTEYLSEIRLSMAHILRCAENEGIRHKFTEKDTKGHALYIVVMGDKGLCGEYNAEIASLTAETKKRDPESKIVVLNSFSEQYLTRKGIHVDHTFDFSTLKVSHESVKIIQKDLTALYMTDDFNEIYIISTQYSSGSRTPSCIRLLPLQASDFADCISTENEEEIIFEPSVNKLFTLIIPEYITGVLYDLLLQANISENASRMEAMKSATDNAGEMLDKLSKQLNSERQIAITQEITEISAAQM